MPVLPAQVSGSRPSGENRAGERTDAAARIEPRRVGISGWRAGIRSVSRPEGGLPDGAGRTGRFAGCRGYSAAVPSVRAGERW